MYSRQMSPGNCRRLELTLTLAGAPHPCPFIPQSMKTTQLGIKGLSVVWLTKLGSSAKKLPLLPPEHIIYINCYYRSVMSVFN